MRTAGLKEITIGVGHLRRQVDFYGTHLGLRVGARGKIPGEIARRLWGYDDDLHGVILSRHDLPDGPRLRLLPTFDLPARPDFDITRPGPLGLLYGTEDMLRAYYRLSGAGVEFHAPPTVVGPRGPRARRHARKVAFGRAFDGEYVVLAQPCHGPLKDGTCSPYFGVTEPRELSVVVADLEPGSRFLRRGLGFESVLRARRGGPAREQAMGLASGGSFTLETLVDPAGSIRVSLICFDGDAPPRAVPEIRPPSRGICALTFDCADLEGTLAACREAGGRGPAAPCSVDHPLVGSGRIAGLVAPFGLLVELRESPSG